VSFQPVTASSTSTSTRTVLNVEPPKPMPSSFKRLGVALVAAGAVAAFLGVAIAPLTAANFMVASPDLLGNLLYL
jgi:hypothetical protein